MIRKDNSDIVYKSEKAKFEAVVDEIIAEHRKDARFWSARARSKRASCSRRCCAARASSATFSTRSTTSKKPRSSSMPGQEAQVTIATNMAGRGTDIKLGEGVAANGGLHIIGTERHESRRIDNQLRGRAGRQGDPGSTRFYISLEDEVMRLFGGERMTNIMDRVGFTDEAADRVEAWCRVRSSARRARSKTTTTKCASTCSSTTT